MAKGATEGKWYVADDEALKRPKKTRRVAGAPKLRSSLTPGTVVILLSGRFRGKRVIFLKQLKSGCLLVTGPYKVNGVPLRRVNQAYVIATSTKVDVSGVKVDHIDDGYFARVEVAKSGEEEFFAAGAKTIVADSRKEDQKKVDAALTAALGKDEILKAYLNSRFSLKSGDKPHEMKF
ncbi:unnamed protein product [Chrysoparadoxa australica]